MPILSLEASTSSAKAMLYDCERGVLGVESLPYPPDVSDGVTFCAEGAVEAVLQCGAQLLARHPGCRVEAIGLSSIWHSLVVLDSEKRPIGRGQTWADTSPAPTVAEYRSDHDFASRFYRTTGCAMHSVYNIWKWMHMRRTADVSRVRHVSCLPEYLFYALTGELVLSQGVAAGSGFLSAHTLHWDPELLSLAGVGEGMLGRLVQQHESMPLSKAVAVRLGLPPGVPVAAAGPDGALNHIAAGGLGSRAMTLSVGTSGALRVANAAPVIPQTQSTWCYYGAEGKYVVGAATSGAGNCVNWFVKDLLGGSMGYAGLEAAAAASNAGGAPYFLPFLFGERCPGWNDSRRGGFASLCGSVGVGELYRCVLEGVLFNLYQNYRILIQNMGFTPQLIGISGGITQSPLWLQMAADIFGAPLEENTGEHASLLGAAYVGAMANGAIASLTDIPAARGRRHEPDAAGSALEAERFSRWMEYYYSKT